MEWVKDRYFDIRWVLNIFVYHRFGEQGKEWTHKRRQ